MALTRKDAAATIVTILVVLVFLASRQGWDVWLIGGSHRWAAAVIALLGIGACALGSPGPGTPTKLLAALGTIALVLAVLALATGSLTSLSLLVVDIVLLWAASTVRHLGHGPRKPLPA